MVIFDNMAEKRKAKKRKELMAQLGVPGLKATMDLMGLYGGPCREPMLPSSAADVERIKSTLQKDKFL